MKKTFVQKFNQRPLIYITAFWFIYLILFMAAERLINTPVWLIHVKLDDMIPFTKYAIPGYYLWFVALVYTSLKFLFEKDRSDLLKFYSAMAIGCFPTLIFYFILPNGTDIRPLTVEGNDLLANLVRIIWAADNTCNVCPSIHVLTTVIINLAWLRSPLLKEKRKTHALFLFFGIIIILSTMFLKQHSVVDVVLGLAVGILADFITQKLLPLI